MHYTLTYLQAWKHTTQILPNCSIIIKAKLATSPIEAKNVFEERRLKQFRLFIYFKKGFRPVSFPET